MKKPRTKARQEAEIWRGNDPTLHANSTAQHSTAQHGMSQSHCGCSGQTCSDQLCTHNQEEGRSSQAVMPRITGPTLLSTLAK
jgi:hypothetical protein